MDCTYDPANGNLLLDVAFNSPTQFTGGQALYYNAGFSASTSRAANPSGGTGGAFTDGFGLETRFTTKATAQVTLANLAQTFDGSPKNVAVTTDPPGLDVVVTYDGSATLPTNAGSYAIVAVVNDPNFTGQASGNLTISKAGQLIAFDPLPNKTLADPDFNISAAASSNLPVSFSANGNCTLTGAQVHLTGAGNLSQSVTVSYSGRNGTTYGPSTTAPTDAGDYTAAASFDGDESHDASSDSKDFTIAKATATITLGDLNQTYTGTPKNASFTITLSNPAGASLGADSTATVTVADNDNATGANPLGTDEFFIRQHYYRLLRS